METKSSFWLTAEHGYFEYHDPALYGVSEKTIDLATFPYDINGRNSGTIAMNGLITAASLAFVRGEIRMLAGSEQVDGTHTIWAEYVREPDDNSDDEIYLIRINLQNTTGVLYTFDRILSAEISRLNREDGSFQPLWNEAEAAKFEFAPYFAFLPVVIAVSNANPDVSKRLQNLSHIPVKKFDDNPNLYWLSDYFFRTRSEYYHTLDDVAPISEESFREFKNNILESRRDWALYNYYHSKESQALGTLSYEEIATAFASEETRTGPLSDLIPAIRLEDYYIDPKLKQVVDLMVLEKDSKIPLNTGMFYGEPASGKSTAVMLMAKMLQLPYIPVTFNSNISMDDLLGSWQPSEDGGIHFVESTFVEAYQRPSVVEFVECYYVKPGACGDLNTALDDTAQITLPNGKVIHRDPHCIIVATINAGVNEQDYRAVREQDASFDRRFEGFKEFLKPFDREVLADIIKTKSGYDDEDEITLMIKAMNDMNRNSNETGDWQTVYPSAVIRWAQHRKYKDIYDAASATVLPAASKNLDVQKDIRENILSNYW